MKTNINIHFEELLIHFKIISIFFLTHIKCINIKFSNISEFNEYTKGTQVSVNVISEKQVFFIFTI